MKEKIEIISQNKDKAPEKSAGQKSSVLPPYLKPLDSRGRGKASSLLRNRWVKAIFVPLSIAAGFFAYEQVKKHKTYYEKPNILDVNINYTPENIAQKTQEKTLTVKQAIERLHLENERKVAAFIGYLAKIKFWNHPTLHSYAPSSIEGKTRAQYVYDKMAGLQKPKVGKGTLTYLSELMPGLVAQESKYYDKAKSKKDALGALQIMPNTYADLRARFKRVGINLPDDPSAPNALHDFKTAVNLAVYHIDKVIYPTLKKSLLRIQRALEIPEDSYNKFAAFVIVNAYNAGQGTIKICLNKFIEHLQTIKEKAQKDEAAALKWKYLKTAGPLELFYIFSRFSYEKKAHPLYREDASSYTFLVAAGTTTLSAFGYFKKVPQKPNMQNIGELIDNINSNSPWWVAKYGIDLNKMPEKELKKILAYAN